MDRQYVGIDFHRRRSVVVRVSATGEKLATTRVANEPLAIAAAVAEAGPDPEVVIEATYGWYWVVDLLQAAGARVHLAINGIGPTLYDPGLEALGSVQIELTHEGDGGFRAVVLDLYMEHVA